MISAKGRISRLGGGFKYALDNGAWTAHCRGEAFDIPAFEKALGLFANDADFVVAPDIVGGGLDSLRVSKQWIQRLLDVTRIVVVPVQEGMTPKDVAPLLSPRVGVFVGGATAAWKCGTVPQWAQIAHNHGSICHVGRVNSAKRIKICALAGADSFDGSSASRYAKTLPLLDAARRQGTLW